MLRKALKYLLNERQRLWVRGYINLFDVVRSDPSMMHYVRDGKYNFGYCPICEGRVIFVRKAEWLRDNYFCLSCNSIPRQRAISIVLKKLYPHWREANIYESSPAGPASSKFQKECNSYISSHYFQDTPLGSYRNGVRCENLECLTFENDSFDLLITQEVFEHVLNPAPAFAEVARVLKPGGAHVFTVPYFYWKKTLVRAVDTPEGIKHLGVAPFSRRGDKPLFSCL